MCSGRAGAVPGTGIPFDGFGQVGFRQVPDSEGVRGFDGFRQVPGSEGGSKFRWVPTGSGVPKGFRWFRDQELQKTCGTQFLPSWGWRNAAGNAVRRVNAFV